MCVGKFARVRVTRRIDEPLVRCVPLVHERLDKEVLVLIQYERLPEFCFQCGRVGHISRDCGDSTVEKGVVAYEGWLRAGRSFVGRRSSGPPVGSTSQGSRAEEREVPRIRAQEDEKRRESEGRMNEEEEEVSCLRVVSQGPQQQPRSGEAALREGVMVEQGGVLKGAGGLEGRREAREMDMLMEEDVVALGEGREKGLGRAEGGEGVGESSQLSDSQLSSGRGRKGWKRLAREKSTLGSVGAVEGEGDQVGGGSRKIVATVEEGESGGGLRVKLQRVSNAESMAFQSAEAALQPRRSP